MATPRRCVVCTTEYSYCPKCGKDNPTETWRTTFCSENCREVFKVCNDFRHKKMTKAQAKKKLLKLDLSKADKFAKTIASAVSDIV